MTYLLDSDTLIFLARGLKAATRSGPQNQKKAAVGQKIKSRCMVALEEGCTIGISVISMCELEFGALGSRTPDAERKNLQRFFTPFQQFSLPTTGFPRHYALIRRDLEKNGEPIGHLDILIAAHAMEQEATLVTTNESHFSRIPGLRWENWCEVS